jgi:RNA polymerase sigma factor (sigma-70 family)
MATSQLSEVIQHFCRTVLLQDGAGLTDGQLLEDYRNRRDEAALAALVGRHAPMVWGVCRRLLRHHDAEDAFQATFLVLVRKAWSIASREQLANWLYGVARQTALKARATTSRRKEREKQVAEMPEPAVAERDLGDDWLDHELSRLPDKYRVVIVLCDLGGKTRKEAARQLGLPAGTVASRLARARAMLAKRLSQRGVAFSVGALAAVPPSLVSCTTKAAGLFAAGQAAAIPVKVVALTEGVLRAMLVTKLKTATVGLLLVALLGGAAGAIYHMQAAEQPKARTATERAEQTQNEAGRTNVKIEQDEAAKPLGRIVEIGQNAKVYIDLGKEDDVHLNRTFSVFGSGSRRANHSPKASLEVVAVLRPHLSLVRVTWLHDPDGEPLVLGDELYNPVSRPQGADPDENAKAEQKRPGQRVEEKSPPVKVYDGDKGVQELIDRYRDLPTNDKLGIEGDRIRERLLQLSRTEQITLSPITRDAVAGILADQSLRQLLRVMERGGDDVKRAAEAARDELNLIDDLNRFGMRMNSRAKKP